MEKTTIYFTVTNDVVGDQRMQRICSSLSMSNYKVFIVGIDKGRHINRNLPYEVIPIKTLFKKGPLFYLEYNLRLISLCITRDFDAINSIDLDTIIACKILSVFKRKKLIFDAHEFFINVPELKGKRIKKFIWRLVEKIFIKKVALAMTVNNTLASKFTERYNCPFHVIRNIPELNKAPIPSKKLPENSIILIYQGALNVGRGLELYIKAMPQLPECRLWICGTGDIDEDLKRIIGISSAHERIEMKGFLAPDDLKEVTGQAHIGLNMLDPNSKSYYYSLANRYFDYIHAGIPSIHMDFPEYNRYNKEFNTCLLVKEYTAEALVNSILSLTNDPDLYARMSENCINARKVYNWNNERKRLIALYDSILINS